MSAPPTRSPKPKLTALLAALGSGAIDPRALFGLDRRVLEHMAAHAEALFGTGRRTQGEALLRALAEVDLRSVYFPMRLAALLARHGDGLGAIAAYRWAGGRTRDPALEQTIAFAIATVWLERGDFERARAELEVAARGPATQAAETARTLSTRLDGARAEVR